MHTNAIESWLVRMYRHAIATGKQVDWNFHVQLKQPGRLELEYPACEPLIYRSPCELSDWPRFFASFFALCRTQRFDVVHIHADVMSAPYLLMARLAGVGRAIVHVHNADENVPVAGTRKQRLLREPMRHCCLAMAYRIVGISNHTLDKFLAGRKRKARRDIVHYYGVDPTPFFQAKPDRAAFRRMLGLPEDAIILLFAGRIVPEKNPVFAVDVLARLRVLEPRAFAVFAGTGSQAAALLDKAKERQIENAVRLIGWRNDLPDVMRCSDLFILPRPEERMEGFGLAVVEAQLAGLRLLLSQAIPDDPILPTASFRRLATIAGPDAWAHAAADLLKGAAPSASDALAALHRSPMDMDYALSALLRLHE